MDKSLSKKKNNKKQKLAMQEKNRSFEWKANVVVIKNIAAKLIFIIKVCKHGDDVNKAGMGVGRG